MVQKAKLDVLDNLPEIEIIAADAQTEVQEEPLPISKEGWAFNKLLLLGAPVFIVALVIIGALWFFLFRTISPMVTAKPDAPVAKIEEKVTPGADNLNIPVAVEPVKMNTAYFKDFLIDMKDKTGKSKILLCDVAFNLSEEKNIAELENRQDIRNVIYQTVKGKNVVALKSIEERKLLKKELSQELNKIIGDGIVKNVYFTNYIIM
jgi:flagellar basal body-associated protein FliL